MRIEKTAAVTTNAARWTLLAVADTLALVRRRLRALWTRLVPRVVALRRSLRPPVGALRRWLLPWMDALRASWLRGVGAQQTWLRRVRQSSSSLNLRVGAPRNRVVPRERRWRHGHVRRGGSAGLVGRYGLYTPSGLRDDERAPLIVVLHGCTQRGVGFAHASGWTDLADAARVRLLCPDQRQLANRHRCWNWFHEAAQNGQGELNLITATIDDVKASVRIDTKAIAAVGVSAGGALSALLAFHRANRFRAVIAVAAPTLLGSLPIAKREPLRRRIAAWLGSQGRGCAPLAIIHGTADRIVHPRCADHLQAQALESLRRAGKHAERERGVAECKGATVTDFRRRGQLLLRRIDLAGHGHAWTGGAGGHPYCDRLGAPLTALCHGFLRDVGMLR